MIDREQRELSVRRQCELLRVSRSGLYYEPEATSPEELALMRRIDELHLKYPFYGSRKLSDALRKEGREANRKRIQRLMRVMQLEALAPTPDTSEPHPEHVKYPYLLRGLVISRVTQVWATDITSIPMKAGFSVDHNDPDPYARARMDPIATVFINGISDFQSDLRSQLAGQLEREGYAQAIGA